MLLTALAALAAVTMCGCADREPLRPAPGDPAAGRVAIQRLQCGACHAIPGVTGARGQVGPPLDAYGRRVYIAGKLPQDPALLARWIADAPSLAPGTAMPKIEMTAAEARDMVAYLYRLR
ncbi:MAG: c-type cytochrome [Pseudomonadota bacterium]